MDASEHAGKSPPNYFPDYSNRKLADFSFCAASSVGGRKSLNPKKEEK